VSNNFFVDKNDILNTIAAMEKTNPVGKTIGTFNLKHLEDQLDQDVWIKSAELFFDNNDILRVIVQEREPIARVFTGSGSTFYIDDELAILPLSEKFSARLPVFTNFPSVNKVLSRADSTLLKDVKTISLAIQKDSFSMAMIEQVDITQQRHFEMIPKIGNQLIVFGDATDTEIKLGKLKLFYKEIMVKAGWDHYSIINLQYRNQLVAKRKGVEDIAADSLRTTQLMQMIAERAQKAAGDSLKIIYQGNDRDQADSSMILQSIQRDDTDETPAPAESAVQKNNPAVLNIVKPAVNNVLHTAKKETKPVQKKAMGNKLVKEPKAVMEKKNDYSPVP
jgi:cell division protein FtsQ